MKDLPLSVAEAQRRLLSFFSPLGKEEVPLAQAAGRLLAERILAPIDLPPFPNSSMDGFALLSADVMLAGREYPVSLAVVADIPAGGMASVTLQAGQAARIMTGAPLPSGADAVVPVEDTDFNHRQPGLEAPAEVLVFVPVAPGENVRPLGQDVHAGEPVLPPRIRLRPQELGFLGMLGISQVPIYCKPRVAVFSTGDEILPVEAPLTPGKIHDANTHILMAGIVEAGGTPVSLGIIPDRLEEVRAALDQAASLDVDLILTSAGVSVGAFDFVRSVVEQGGRLNFWRVNMRPGKPLAFGHYRDIPFIGLPGNPVSAFVGFEVFVRPALLKLAGVRDWQRIPRKVELLESITSDGRESYLRGIVSWRDGRLIAELTGHQGSGNLRSLVQANALLLVPSGVKSLPAGAEINAWLMGDIQTL